MTPTTARVLVAQSSALHLGDHLAAMRAVAGVASVDVVDGDWGATVQPGDIVVVDYFVDRACVREAARRGAAWLHILSAGVNAFPLAELDVPVITCSRGISAGPISEFVVAMMLAHEKQLDAVFHGQPVDDRLGELGGRHLAVLGLGGIGGRVARLGLAFGMQVRGLRRRPVPLPAALDGVELVDEVGALVAGAHHLVLCAPLTPATHDLIDAGVLRLVRPGVHLVNVARGGLVDHDALLEALDDGRVARASLDVTEPEPLPPDHPLRRHPRVTLTPHLSGLVEQAEPRNWGVFVENLGRYLDGRDLLGVVDRDAGYWPAEPPDCQLRAEPGHNDGAPITRNGGSMPHRWGGNAGRDGTRARTLRAAAAVAAIGLVAAACGGGGGRKAPNASATTSTSEEATTTTVATGAEAGGTATTAAPGSGVTTATTAASGSSSGARSTRATTATTAKKSTTGANKPSGGITNVTSAPTTAPSADIQAGGTITFLKASDTLGYDPINLNANSGADAPTSFAVFGALVYNDPADGVVKPQMADSLTSTDALVWTLHLRPNVKFTDGTTYDAAAVRFNWARLQDPANRAQRAAAANLISAMDVVDPLTLKITLKAKNAVFPQTVALIPYVGSPAAIQQKGTNFNSDPVGAGPFVLKSWTRDSQTVFVPNPTYWDAPRPYVDQVIAKPIIDESQRANTLLSGAANMLFTVTPQTADQLKKGGATEYAAVQNGGPNIIFNMRQGRPFADIRARKAIAAAIDRCDLVKTVLNGAVECEDSIFRHNSPYYDPTVVQAGYNPTEAQQLFDQLAAEQGGTFKFTILDFPTGNFPAEGQYIQSKLNSYAHVRAELNIVAVNLLISSASSGNFDISIYSNPFDDPEPTWTSLYTCANQAQFTGYCSPKFDAAVADNQLTLNPQQRINDLKEAQRQFYADIPGVYFERRVTWNFGAANVQGVQFVNDGTVLWDRVWIKAR